MTPRRFDLVLWLAAWGLLGLNLFFSFGPPPPGSSAFAGADKVLHAGAYAVTVGAFLLAAVWRPGRGEGRYPQAVPLILLLAVALGAGSEVLQGTAFRREADVLDGIADLVGIGLGYAGWRLAAGSATRG